MSGIRHVKMSKSSRSPSEVLPSSERRAETRGLGEIEVHQSSNKFPLSHYLNKQKPSSSKVAWQIRGQPFFTGSRLSSSSSSRASFLLLSPLLVAQQGPGIFIFLRMYRLVGGPKRSEGAQSLSRPCLSSSSPEKRYLSNGNGLIDD